MSQQQNQPKLMAQAFIKKLLSLRLIISGTRAWKTHSYDSYKWLTKPRARTYTESKVRHQIQGLDQKFQNTEPASVSYHLRSWRLGRNTCFSTELGRVGSNPGQEQKMVPLESLTCSKICFRIRARTLPGVVVQFTGATLCRQLQRD